MANDSILTPGKSSLTTVPLEDNTSEYLKIDNYLSEFADVLPIVQENLNVPSKDSVYDKQATDIEISKKIREALQEYLNADDPHGILPQVEELIRDMAKTDGSTPFTAPQSGVNPISDAHLTTKRFVTQLLKSHENAEDPHGILPEVRNILESYVKLTDIYSKSQLYTKDEIDRQHGQFLQKNGTTPFTKPQVGVDPTIDSHLATKRYTDAVIYKHLVDVDPHGFIAILNNRLAPLAKKKDVYDKTQTYSRSQIDSMIIQSVNQALESAIQDFMATVNDKIENIRKQPYTKSDGTTPFKAPQKGVKAKLDNELTTLEQVQELVNAKNAVWVTSGPVEAAVGLVEEGTTFKNEVTFQEAMDAIFYGKRVKFDVPESTQIGTSTLLTVCISGSLANVSHAEVYQGEEVIRVITIEDFEEFGCVMVETNPINSDTDFTLKVYYNNDSVYEMTGSTKVAYAVFVGLLPKWKFGNTINFAYLEELTKEDSLNNKFYYESESLSEIEHYYNFEDKTLKHIMVALPETYPDLTEMNLVSQKFGPGAFDVIDMIPFQISGKDIVYKLYIYRQALVRLDSAINFKF